MPVFYARGEKEVIDVIPADGVAVEATEGADGVQIRFPGGAGQKLIDQLASREIHSVLIDDQSADAHPLFITPGMVVTIDWGRSE